MLQVIPLPGRGNKKIRRVVEGASIRKTDLVIIDASSNNEYRKDGMKGAAQPVT